MKIHIGIVTDWERSSRRNEWNSLLNDIARMYRLDIDITQYPMADLIMRQVAPDEEERLPTIRDNDILIVNWDAINGDPDFGSHLALRWFEHRRPEILLWVKRGNILIVESQAVLGVPCQTAYDAIAGENELPVCGVENPKNPLHFRKRIGATCTKTSNFPEAGGFNDVEDPLKSPIRTHLTSAAMFPNGALKLLTEDIYDLHWEEILYRGWFRKMLPAQTRFPWVSIVKTADRKGWRDQSVMKVAKIESGAIFATTMCLATTAQTRLVHAMISCRGGNTSHLPNAPSVVSKFRKYCETLLTVSSGALAGLLVTHLTDLASVIASYFPLKLFSSAEKLEDLISVLLIPAGMIVFEVLRIMLNSIKEFAFDFIGY